MKNIIIGSMTENAGKTSFIVGLGKAIGKKFGYLKPFGDRVIYRKKRLWDHDAALITNIFKLEQSSEDMTIGFWHSKLRYMYDEASTRAKLLEMVHNLIAKASDMNIPVLLVPFDTFQAAKQLDDMVPLLTKDDTERIRTLEKLIEQNINIKNILPQKDYDVYAQKILAYKGRSISLESSNASIS